jgi:LytS/YehU family sensor histidine kinase
MQARAVALERQQLLNEIALLRTQVNPHFLFNSLSILSSLVHVNADLSEQFIDQLSRSYRYILEQKDQSLVTLRTELEFIRSYIFLLKIRFENKLDLHIHLTDSDLDSYKIAPLTLQLLVENVVKHNRMSNKEPLLVRVERQGDWLEVRNPFRPRGEAVDSTGTGLQNIINRYALLTDRPVWAGEREDEFVVKIPLLNGAVTHDPPVPAAKQRGFTLN